MIVHLVSPINSNCLQRALTPKDTIPVYTDVGRYLARGVDPFISPSVILYHGTNPAPATNDSANTVQISEE